MERDHDIPEGDERYFEDTGRPLARVFDTNLLRESLDALPRRKPIVLAPHDSVTDAVRAMQGEHRGCIVVTEDGTPASRTVGIFTERDVLERIVDRGRNPVTLPLRDVMTTEPEAVHIDESIAYLLNKMCVGGFRHVPVVDQDQRPISIISVRDVVQFFVESFPREILNLPDPATKVSRSRKREGA